MMRNGPRKSDPDFVEEDKRTCKFLNRGPNEKWITFMSIFLEYRSSVSDDTVLCRKIQFIHKARLNFYLEVLDTVSWM